MHGDKNNTEYINKLVYLLLFIELCSHCSIFNLVIQHISYIVRYIQDNNYRNITFFLGFLSITL